MADGSGVTGRWENFRPSKALWLWSCAGCIAATMILGFTVGGWVMGGTAEEMAESAREEGRAELAAQLCVNRFVAAPGAAETLESLKEASSWDRDDLIEKGGWANLPGNVAVIDGSIDLCAEKLAAMEALPAVEADSASAMPDGGTRKAVADEATTDGAADDS